VIGTDFCARAVACAAQSVKSPCSMQDATVPDVAPAFLTSATSCVVVRPPAGRVGCAVSSAALTSHALSGAESVTHARAPAARSE